MDESLILRNNVAKIRKEKGLEFEIEIDGGVDLNNAKSIVDAGCDILVVGSQIFHADDIGKRTEDFIGVIK